MLLAVAQLSGSDDRAEPELPLAHQWLGINREPRFSLSRKHVVAVEILMQQHLLTL